MCVCVCVRVCTVVCCVLKYFNTISILKLQRNLTGGNNSRKQGRTEYREWYVRTWLSESFYTFPNFTHISRYFHLLLILLDLQPITTRRNRKKTIASYNYMGGLQGGGQSGTSGQPPFLGSVEAKAKLNGSKISSRVIPVTF